VPFRDTLAPRPESESIALPVAQLAHSFIQEQDFAARQYRGRREHQEDYYAFADASEPGQPPLTQLLLVVGDGLGAHTGGSVASYVGVGAFIRAFQENKLTSGWRLRTALDAANDTIGLVTSRLPAHGAQMGTTLIGLHLTPTTMQWVSVGDSPLFMYRDGKVLRINADHSLAPVLAERVRQGELTQAESDHHPDRHTLQSALLGLPMALVDAPPAPIAVHKDDIIIAASDGILTLTDRQMEDLLSFGRHTTADKIADAIIFAIRRVNHERQDNTTVAVIKIG
jgi:PPM family protein phosphatase